MGKDTFNHNKPSSRSSKPYDVSNSFVRKVASRVSGYFVELFSRPEVNSQGTRTTPDPELTDSPSLTRVGRLDYASSFLNMTTEVSKKIKTKIFGPEQTHGPSPLQTRYELENFKFGSNAVESGILSTESSGLHKLLNKPTDSPIPNYSGLQLSLGKIESPVSRETRNQSSAGLRTFDMKYNIDSSKSRKTPYSSVTGRNKQARVDPKAKSYSVSDDDSESSESTSGSSSSAPQVGRIISQSAFVLSSRRKPLDLDDKLSYVRQLKESRNSLYLNRRITVNAETPRSSRTPSFDVSAYGKSIPKTSVREAMFSSPFYPGRTTYGGAAAARRRSLGTSSYRYQIAVKPAAQPQDGINMSHTARRILAAIEEFSTPLNAAKRIPPPAPPNKRQNIEKSSSERLKRPALTVPTVADMLKMRRLKQIQDSTAIPRQIAKALKPRPSGKIVTKIKNRDKTFDDPPPPPPNLPKVTLQLSSLPKFNLPLLNTVQTTVAASSPSFTFSSSSVSTSSSLQSAPPIQKQFNFSPSEWIQPNKPNYSIVVTSESAAPENIRTLVPVAELDENSVMDILGKSVVKPTECINVESVTSSTAPRGFGGKLKPWTSSNNSSPTCYRNQLLPPSTFPNNETPLLNTKSLLGFGDKFKPASGSWSCEDCMVLNKVDSTKCVSCSASKPGLAGKDVTKTGSWKCVVCLIPNDSDCENCSSCESSRHNKILNVRPKFDFGLPSVDFKFGIDLSPSTRTASNGPIPTEFEKATNAPVSTRTFKFGIARDEPESEKKSVDSLPMEVYPSPTNKNPESTSVKSSFLPAATTSDTGFTFGNPTTSTTLPAHLGTKYQGFGLNGSLSKNIADDLSAPSVYGTTTITSVASNVTAPTFGASTAGASIFGKAPASKTTAFGSVASSQIFGSTSTPKFGVISSTPFGNPSSGLSNPFGIVPAQPVSGQTPALQASPSSSSLQFGASDPSAAYSRSLSVPSSFNNGGQTPTFSADPQSTPEPKMQTIRAWLRYNK